MFDILLSNSLGACFGPSTEKESMFFRRFTERKTRLSHNQVQQGQPPLTYASEVAKKFILQHCKKYYPRDDHREFLNLEALMVGFDIHTLRKPDLMHPARWMAKAIYSMKIELLFRDNKTVIKI